MTVLGCANDETILGALQEANKCNRLIAVDLIAVPNKLRRAQQLEHFGVHYIGIHTGMDQQVLGATPLFDLKQIRFAVNTPLVVAVGCKYKSIDATPSPAPACVDVGCP